MATTITFACGHTEDRNLAGRRPFELERVVGWLTTRPCRECDPASGPRRARWVAARRAQELRDARGTEARFDLAPLGGPDQIRDWATRVRAVLVETAYDQLGLDDTEFAAQIADPAGRVDSAGWWLDHRELPIDQLAAALRDALVDTTAATGTQNPY